MVKIHASLALFSLLISGLVSADPVTDARLLNAASESANWLGFGHNYTNQRFARLDQINLLNVAELKRVWTFRSKQKGPFQAQALVADGIMYVTLPGNHVVALDAASGVERWRYEHVKRRPKTKGSPANRGAALGYGKVFEATNDGRLIALDEMTGEVVWDRVIAQALPSELEGLSVADQAILRENVDKLPAKMPPLVYKGMVIVGVTSAGYGIYYNLGVKTRQGPAPQPATFLGQRGFVAAFDAASGEEIWRWHTTKSGDWEGMFSATTGQGESLGRDIESERANASKLNETWRIGGSSTWSTPSLDPSLGLLYVGTGNGSPNDVPSARPGDNLYTSSLVALDVETGQVRWYYQQVPQDVWGYDVASASILFDANVDGKNIPAVGIAGKTGWFYVHDRRSGELLYRSEALVPHENLFVRPNEAGVLISPGSFGGVSWSPGSYDARSGLAYFAAIHRPTLLTKHFAEEAQGRVAYTATDIARDEPTWGTLSAVDTRDRGRIRWQLKTDEPLIGGVLATAGGLVFVGEGSGRFSAVDAATGARLWSDKLSAGVNAPPVSYAVDGKQFVAVAAGGSRFFGFPPGDLLVAYALE